MRSRRLLFFLLVGAMLLAARGQAETLQIAGDDSYPMVVRGANGVADGVFVRLLARLERMTGDTYVLKPMPWSRALEAANRGEVGIIGMPYSHEKAKLFDYSIDIYEDEIQIVALKSHVFAYGKLDDLKGKVMGGLNGASYGQTVDQAIAAGMFTVQRDTSHVGRLGKLLAGRVQGAFISNGPLGFEAVLAGDPGLQSQRDAFVVLPQPLVRQPLHLAFSKSMHKREAIARFDEALKKLKKSGELKTIVSSSFK